MLEMINNRQIQLIINDTAVNKEFWADAPLTKTRLSAARQLGLAPKRVAPARRKLDRTSSQQCRGDLQQWRIAAAAKASHLPSLCSLLSTAGA